MNPDATLRLQRELRARQPDWKEAEAALRDEADINVRESNKNGPSFLVLASSGGRVDHVRWLLAHGANPNVVSKFGWTALMSAALQGHTEIVALLLEAGADPNTRDAAGETALMYAGGHAEIIRRLLDQGADPNARSRKDGSTVLMYAIRPDNPDAITMLLDHGADPAMRDRWGRTIPELFMANRNPKLIEFLDETLARPMYAGGRFLGSLEQAMAARGHLLVRDGQQVEIWGGGRYTSVSRADPDSRRQSVDSPPRYGIMRA